MIHITNTVLDTSMNTRYGILKKVRYKYVNKKNIII